MSFNNDHDIFYNQNNDKIFEDLAQTIKTHQTVHAQTKNNKIFSNESIEVSIDSHYEYFNDFKKQSDAKNTFNILSVQKSKFNNELINL